MVAPRAGPGASFAFQDLLDTDIRAGEEAQHAERNDGDILPQPPVPLAEAVLLFPDGHQFDYRREHEAQRGQTHSPDEGDEWTQIGDRDRHADGEDHQYDTEEVLAEQSTGAEVLLGVLPDNLHRHVELKSIGEEDRNGDHYLGGLRQHLVLRGIERNGGLRALAIFPVAEETHGTVQQYDAKHTSVENTRATDEMRWCFHVVLQRHYLKIDYRF